MFAKTLKIWLFSMLFAGIGYADGIVAVLEVVVADDADDEDDGKTELTVQQTMFLTDELRKQATMALSGTHTVLTREKIIELSVKVPANAATVVDIGRAIGSDYITRGSLERMGNAMVFTVELYNCESGRLLAHFTKMAPDLKGLLEIVHENVPALFNNSEMRNELPVLPQKNIDVIEEKQTEEKKGELQGQEQKHKEDLEKITIGIRTGFNLYKYFEKDYKYDLGKGYGGGLTVRIPLASKLFLNPSLDAYYRELFSWEKGNGTMNEFVISIPILLQFTPIERGSFFLFAGPQVDIPIMSKLKYKDETYDIGRAKVDVNAVLGLGYIIIPSLVIDIKAGMDITPVFDKFGLFMQSGLGLAYFF